MNAQMLQNFLKSFFSKERNRLVPWCWLYWKKIEFESQKGMEPAETGIFIQGYSKQAKWTYSNDPSNLKRSTVLA